MRPSSMMDPRRQRYTSRSRFADLMWSLVESSSTEDNSLADAIARDLWVNMQQVPLAVG